MSSLKLKHSGGNSVIIAAPSSNPAADRTITCPDLTANAVMATTNGITEFDQWYLNTGTVSSNGDITSNLTRMDFAGSAAQIGTGMTQSNGIFTFPRTGKFLIVCNASLNCDGSDTVILYTAITTNNSSYTNVALAMDGNNGTGNRTGAATSFFLLDVTDTSQVKAKFVVGSISGGSSIRGTADSSTDAVTTNFVFIRLGDT